MSKNIFGSFIMDFDKNKIYFAKVKNEGIIPTKEKWNAGFDIYPCFEQEYMIIKPGETVLVPTGIASAVPQGYYIQIQERGSSGSKGIKYSAGVIDSSYRGEWFLATTNANFKPVIILKKNIDEVSEPEKSIIQEGYVIYPYSKALFQGIVHCVHNEFEVCELSFDELASVPSKRGTGKLGSSGK